MRDHLHATNPCLSRPLHADVGALHALQRGVLRRQCGVACADQLQATRGTERQLGRKGVQEVGRLDLQLSRFNLESTDDGGEGLIDVHVNRFTDRHAEPVTERRP